MSLSRQIFFAAHRRFNARLRNAHLSLPLSPSLSLSHSLANSLSLSPRRCFSTSSDKKNIDPSTHGHEPLVVHASKLEAKSEADSKTTLEPKDEVKPITKNDETNGTVASSEMASPVAEKSEVSDGSKIDSTRIGNETVVPAVDSILEVESSDKSESSSTTDSTPLADETREAAAAAAPVPEPNSKPFAPFAESVSIGTSASSPSPPQPESQSSEALYAYFAAAAATGLPLPIVDSASSRPIPSIPPASTTFPPPAEAVSRTPPAGFPLPFAPGHLLWMGDGSQASIVDLFVSPALISQVVSTFALQHQHAQSAAVAQALTATEPQLTSAETVPEQSAPESSASTSSPPSPDARLSVTESNSSSTSTSESSTTLSPAFSSSSNNPLPSSSSSNPSVPIDSVAHSRPEVVVESPAIPSITETVNEPAPTHETSVSTPAAPASAVEQAPPADHAEAHAYISPEWLPIPNFRVKAPTPKSAPVTIKLSDDSIAPADVSETVPDSPSAPIPSAHEPGSTTSQAPIDPSSIILSKPKNVLVVGIVGAYLSICQQTLPLFSKHAKVFHSLGVDRLVVVSVNDHAVLKKFATEISLDLNYISLLADQDASFVHRLGLSTDLTVAGMGIRSRRFVMLVREGVVLDALVENNIGEVTVTHADYILERFKSPAFTSILRGADVEIAPTPSAPAPQPSPVEVTPSEPLATQKPSESTSDNSPTDSEPAPESGDKVSSKSKSETSDKAKTKNDKQMEEIAKEAMHTNNF